MRDLAKVPGVAYLLQVSTRSNWTAAEQAMAYINKVSEELLDVPKLKEDCAIRKGNRRSGRAPQRADDDARDKMAYADVCGQNPKMPCCDDFPPPAPRRAAGNAKTRSG